MKAKVSRIDYSKAMLPRTRKEQLGDCFKMNYSILLKCGLFLLLFFLPLIGFCIFMDFYYVSLMAHSTEEIEQTRTVYFYILNSGLVVLSLPVIIAISGITHVLRTWIWGEGIFFLSDFGAGIKQNAPKNLIFGFICGAIFFLSYFIFSIINIQYASYFPLVIFVLVFFPVYFWLMFLNNTYDSKWTVLLKNSFFLYIKTIGWSLLGILMPPSLASLYFINSLSLIYIKYIILVLFIVFVFPIIFLIMNLYSTARFDQYINKENYPDYYLKGLNHD